MKTSLYSPKCPIFQPRKDAFWVECTIEETGKYILPRLNPNQKERFNNNREGFLSTRWATVNPGLAEPDRYYFLVAADGSEIHPEEPHMPYGGMWNASNPFVRIEPCEFDRIEELDDLVFVIIYDNIIKQ